MFTKLNGDVRYVVEWDYPEGLDELLIDKYNFPRQDLPLGMCHIFSEKQLELVSNE